MSMEANQSFLEKKQLHNYEHFKFIHSQQFHIGNYNRFNGN